MMIAVAQPGHLQCSVSVFTPWYASEEMGLRMLRKTLPLVVSWPQERQRMLRKYFWMVLRSAMVVFWRVRKMAWHTYTYAKTLSNDLYGKYKELANDMEYD